MSRKIKMFPPPDCFHLSAAEGWLELGKHLEASEELARIAPPMRTHPTVLTVRYEVFAKSGKWEEAAEMAGTLVKVLPEKAFPWVCWAYATRRKTGGGIAAARQILTEAEPQFPAEYILRYNLACYECQLGNLSEAMKWLEKAIALAGKKEIRQMALDDPDLEPLWKRISEI